MEERYLYVILSATPNRIGGFIRRVTDAVYNHASISLDPRLQTMYGFARRYYRTPFYGGFVRETPARYCIGGVSAHIEVYRIPVSPDDYRILKKTIFEMYENRDKYLYNHFSAWVFPLRCRIPAKDAYVCVEFCVEMLQRAGIGIDPGKHYTIEDIRRLLKPYRAYIGPMLQSDQEDREYFSRRPLLHPIWSSLCSIAALIPRIGRK